MARPTMFDDTPTKRPHFFFLIPGKKYFALRKCASKVSSERLSPCCKIEVIDGAIWKIACIIHDDIDLAHIPAL